METTLTNRN